MTIRKPFGRKERAYYGPQHVGGVFRSGYWRYTYKVVSLNPDGSITIEIIEPGVFANTTIGKVGEQITHRTGWDYGRDQLVSFAKGAA